MDSGKTTSIRSHLRRIIVISCGSCILVVSMAFFAYEYVTFKEVLLNDLTNKADILAENCNVALAFHDSSDASKVLSSLASQPEVTSAAVYDISGSILATYRRVGFERPFLGPNGGKGARFEGDLIVVDKPITLNGSNVGILFVGMDLTELQDRFQSHAIIAFIVFLGALAMAYVVALLLERKISVPVMALAQTAHDVSNKQDFTIRASESNVAEIGVLARAMNAMLELIVERESNLRGASEEIIVLNAQLEERVRKRTAQLEEANKELEAFSYSVSHDLRAPLRHIDGYSQLLQKHLGNRIDEKGMRFLSTISESAKRMGQLIDELLVFSQMGRIDMGNTVVDLNGLAVEVLKELQVDHQGPPTKITLDPLPFVTGDRAMLRLVLINLLSNAFKYSRKKNDPRVHIGSRNENDRSVCFVRDNGAGFDMKYADKLFGVFQRLHRSDEFEGTGIGLANVKRIILRHNGSVWAESAVDHGATFFFALPKSGDDHA